jgi:hypothetical protein
VAVAMTLVVVVVLEALEQAQTFWSRLVLPIQ